MCRYTFSGPYKDHNVCFHCRKMFKGVLICPQCGKPTHNLGLDFKVPKQDDVKQWRKVELLYAHGIRFASCGCGPGYRPATLNEAQRCFVKHATRKRPKTKSEKKAAKVAARRRK
jgi:hypothetical protein